MEVSVDFLLMVVSLANLHETRNQVHANPESVRSCSSDSSVVSPLAIEEGFGPVAGEQSISGSWGLFHCG